jgi:hypothetical protein
MSINTTLTGTIVITDLVTNNLLANKTLANISYLGSVSTIAETVSIPNSPTSIALPVSPTQVVYIKNTHATQTLTVTWTPQGGSSNPVVTLQPGAYILFGEPVAGGGISALSLQGSAANTSVEYILVG